MNARETILNALRAPAEPRPEPIRPAAPIRPPVPADVVGHFMAMLAQPSVAATAERIAGGDALPGAVARYLAANSLGNRIFVPDDPRLSGDWSGIERLPAIPVDGGAALAPALAGVAETGSLVLETGPHAPMLPNFLALHHLVALPASRVVPYLEDIPWHHNPPRAHYWITGVSGTTDIEGQYVRGAHGPRFLHVILID